MGKKWWEEELSGSEIIGISECQPTTYPKQENRDRFSIVQYPCNLPGEIADGVAQHDECL